MAMKTLYLNRHAKSSWKDSSLRDFDRPLNKRGRINADFLSVKFAQNHGVDKILSSPAVRALTTAITFAKALGIEEDEVSQNKDIYGASIEEMMAIINGIEDENDTVMLFGHNPTFELLAAELDHNFNQAMVTCARVKIEFDFDSWAHLNGQQGHKSGSFPHQPLVLLVT